MSQGGALVSAILSEHSQISKARRGCGRGRTSGMDAGAADKENKNAVDLNRISELENGRGGGRGRGRGRGVGRGGTRENYVSNDALDSALTDTSNNCNDIVESLESENTSAEKQLEERVEQLQCAYLCS